MRYYKLKLIGLIFVLSITSCNLEQTPLDTLTDRDFYKNDNDAQGAVNYMYDIFPSVNYYGRYFLYVSLLGAEQYSLKADAEPADIELDQWNILPSNVNLEGVYRSAFITIDRANAVLDNVVLDNPNISEEVKKQALGEASFVRALCNFNLVRIFGAVVTRTKQIETESEIFKSKSSIAEVYDIIISDLNTAIESLEATQTQGSANKDAAQGLLAKVYLHLASSKATGAPGYEFVTDASAFYTRAAENARAVLTSGVYQFWEGDLVQLWDVDNEVGNEFIFSIAIDASGSAEEDDFSTLAKLQIPFLGAKILLPPDFTVEIPDGWNHLQTRNSFYTLFDDVDKRKTELMIDEVKIGDQTVRFPGDLVYPFNRKPIDKNQVSDNSFHDIPVIRFSDIALVFAEAVGPTTEGYEWVNKIRNRAGLTDMPAGLSQNDFRKAVLEERNFELAFEGERIFDLRRTNSVIEILSAPPHNIRVDPQYADFYPTPLIETTLNPSN